MKRNQLIVLFLLCLVLFSCVNSSSLEKVSFSPYPIYEYVMDVPPEYEVREIGSPEEYERRYIYGKYSYLYISSLGVSSNSANMSGLYGIIVYRYHGREWSKTINKITKRGNNYYVPDTFEMSGTDDLGLYWKDRKIGAISCGYKNVPEEKKVLFDSALETFRVIKGKE